MCDEIMLRGLFDVEYECRKMKGDERNPPVNRMLDRLQETIKGIMCASSSTEDVAEDWK